jgi:hypothetical protein
MCAVLLPFDHDKRNGHARPRFLTKLGVVAVSAHCALLVPSIVSCFHYNIVASSWSRGSLSMYITLTSGVLIVPSSSRHHLCSRNRLPPGIFTRTQSRASHRRQIFLTCPRSFAGRTWQAPIFRARCTSLRLPCLLSRVLPGMTLV